jgi:glycosyltransferase involved in cell wall biosynthesis
MRTLHIGIEARAAGDVLGGRGRYVRELLRALRALDEPPRLTLLTRQPWPDLVLGPDDRWFEVNGSGAAWAVRAAAHVPSLGIDVLFTPTSHSLAAMTTTPAVTLVHDAFAFERPEVLPPGAWLERYSLRAAAWRGRDAICTSEATRQALGCYVPRLIQRLTVVPLAAAPIFFNPAPLTHGWPPYILTVGTLEPRKNLPRLLDAFTRAQVDADLVVVGQRGWEAASLDRALQDGGDRIRTLGPVSDAELASLYAGAGLVCLPSLAEGFGLPVLEAMAAGAPVLTSDCSSLPEVAGDAAVLVNPLDVDAIAQGITQGFQNRELAERGRLRAAQFSWERVARETLNVLAQRCG